MEIPEKREVRLREEPNKGYIKSPFFLSLTDDPAISLKDLLHVDLVDLEGVEVAHEDPGVDGVGVLRARLVADLAQIHLVGIS